MLELFFSITENRKIKIVEKYHVFRITIFIYDDNKFNTKEDKVVITFGRVKDFDAKYKERREQQITVKSRKEWPILKM